MPKMNTPRTKQVLNTGLDADTLAKENDPYSWKYFYKMAKERKAQRDEETGSIDSNKRLFSQGPLTSEAKVPSIGIQLSSGTPIIKMIDKSKKLHQ